MSFALKDEERWDLGLRELDLCIAALNRQADRFHRWCFSCRGTGNSAKPEGKKQGRSCGRCKGWGHHRV